VRVETAVRFEGGGVEGDWERESRQSGREIEPAVTCGSRRIE